MSTKKSYRKYAVTTMAAAATVAAVVPAVSAQSETGSFSDVSVNSVGQEAYDAIENLASKDIITGKDGEFNPWAPIARAQVSKMFVRAKNLEIPANVEKALEDYSDVSKEATADKEAIAAVTEAGYFSGNNGKFMPWSELTREQMASVLVDAYNLEDYDNGKDVEVDFKGVDASHKEAVQILANLEITTETQNFQPTNNIGRAQFSVMLQRTMDVVNKEVAPEVESVSAINSKELVITFTEAVSEADATADKVVLNNNGTPVAWDGVELSEDGKTLTLTATGVIDVEDAVLTVEPIKTAADEEKTIGKYVTLFTYSDTAAPTVVKLEAQNGKAVITFDEDISSSTGLGVSVNGNDYTDVTLSGKTLTINNLTDEETYNVQVVGAKDEVGNISNPVDFNFTVAKADEALTQAVTTSAKNNKVTLNFVNELSASNVAKVQFVNGKAHNTVGGELELNGTDAAGVTYSEDKKTVTIDTQALGVLAGLNFLNTDIVISEAGLTDAVTVKSTLTSDTTPAKLVSSQTTKEGKLLLEFDEEVVNPATLDLNVTHIDGIYQSTPTTWTGNAVAYAKDASGNDINNKLEVTLPVIETGIPHVVEVPATIQDAYTNASEKFSVTVQVPEADAADAEAVVTVTPDFSAGDVIKLTFANTSENKGVTNSALSLSNYTLAGKALPEGTVVRFVDDRQNVEIVLPAGSINTSGDYVLTLENIVDNAGNTLADGNTGFTVSLVENTAPTVLDVTTISSSEVAVKFSEEVAHFDIDGDLATVAEVEGVTIKVNGTAVDATVAPASIVGDTLTINDLELETGDTVSIEFKDAEIADTNDNLLADVVAQ